MFITLKHKLSAIFVNVAISYNYIIAEGDLLKPLKTLQKKYNRNIK